MKHAIILLGIGAVIAAAGYGAGRHAAMQGEPLSLAQLQSPAWLKQHLDLAAVQEEKLEAIERDYKNRLIALCKEHCAARQELATQLIEMDERGEAEQELLEHMGKLQVETDTLTLEHIRQVRQVLTADQRLRYNRWVAACLQVACPHHLHHGAVAHKSNLYVRNNNEQLRREYKDDAPTTR